MFYLSRFRLSVRLSRLSRLFVSPRFSCPFISSSFYVSPISLRFSRLFVFLVSLVFSHLSSLRLSHLFISPLVPVNRSLPSPWLGYSYLHGSATPVSVLPSKSLLKTTTYILKRND